MSKSEFMGKGIRILLDQDFEHRMRLGRLFDIYGGLLTEKQQECLNFYFNDDLSLTEIAEQTGVSRQAIHDLLKRVEQILERNEAKLGLYAKSEENQNKLRNVIKLLSVDKQSNKEEAIRILNKMCGESR